MYIVKRPFRNLGRVMTVGSVITEPTEIKRFKGRLAEGKILFVPDKDLEKTKAFFKSKYGVDISDTKVKKEDAPKTAAPKAVAPKAPAKETAPKETAKKTVKVTAK